MCSIVSQYGTVIAQAAVVPGWGHPQDDHDRSSEKSLDLAQFVLELSDVRDGRFDQRVNAFGDDSVEPCSLPRVRMWTEFF